MVILSIINYEYMEWFDDYWVFFKYE
jgi:hypothetical protein